MFIPFYLAYWKGLSILISKYLQNLTYLPARYKWQIFRPYLFRSSHLSKEASKLASSVIQAATIFLCINVAPTKIQNLKSFQCTIQSIFRGRKGTQEKFWFVSIFHNNQSHQFELCNVACSTYVQSQAINFVWKW